MQRLEGALATAAFVVSMSAATRTHAEVPAPGKPLTPLQRVPGAKARNIVFILTDDHRYDAHGLHGAPVRSRRRTWTAGARAARICKNAFVTTSLCSPSRAHRSSPASTRTSTASSTTTRRFPPGTDVLPAVSAAGRLPDGVLRQVAHGQRRRRAAAGLRPLGQLPGPGHPTCPSADGAERRRQAGAAEGLHHRRADRLRARLAARRARQDKAVLPVPVAQGRPRRLRARRPATRAR